MENILEIVFGILGHPFTLSFIALGIAIFANWFLNPGSIRKNNKEE